VNTRVAAYRHALKGRGGTVAYFGSLGAEMKNNDGIINPKASDAEVSSKVLKDFGADLRLKCWGLDFKDPYKDTVDDAVNVNAMAVIASHKEPISIQLALTSRLLVA